MNCGDARRLFGAYWDDEVTLAEREWLEPHFAACGACRAEYESFARAIELVGSLPRAEVLPGMSARALARARRAAAVPDRLPVRPVHWVPITATAALLAIIATMTLQSLGIAPTVRLARHPEVAAISEPVLVSRPDVGAIARRASDEPGRVSGIQSYNASATAVPDSLFDHSADVEFILDPVVLRKGRAHTKLRLGPNVQGEKAVITF